MMGLAQTLESLKVRTPLTELPGPGVRKRGNGRSTLNRVSPSQGERSLRNV